MSKSQYAVDRSLLIIKANYFSQNLQSSSVDEAYQMLLPTAKPHSWTIMQLRGTVARHLSVDSSFDSLLTVSEEAGYTHQVSKPFDRITVLAYNVARWAAIPR